MKLLISFTAALVGAGSLPAQQVPDQGVLLIRRGADTLVTDRFVRTADSLTGRVTIQGQPRIEYAAALGPRETVRSLTVAVFAADAAPGAQPLQRVSIVMQGDTAIADTPGGVQRVPTKAGAVPMFNNALALSEIFTRRAKAAGGSATVPYFAIAGGATIDAMVQTVGPDSMTVAIGPQTQRFKVDATGRILGGIIGGTTMEFVRGSR